MKITVLVDIDDTLIQLLPSWVGYLNRRYGLNVDYNSITDWNVAKFFPSLSREQVYDALAQEEIWQTIKPIPGAAKYLKKLIDEDFNIYLVTATDYRNVYPKFEYVIKKYFPYITWDRIIVASNKSMIKGDYLIDDGFHNFKGGTYYPILFDAPHNRNVDVVGFGDGYSVKYTRVYDWEHIYYLLRNFKKEKTDKLYSYRFI
jgi:5'(3')-deoxyribonucleotidase